MRNAITITGLLLTACLAVSGQVHYVSHWGSHTPPFDSWETAATNVVDALDVASDGAVVWVTNGVYRSGSADVGGLHARAYITRAITLGSINGASHTVLEGAFHSASVPVGSDAVRTLYMTNGVLDGFTLRRGGTAEAGDESAISGGGVYADGGVLRNIRVAGNHGQTAGGAWLQNCSVSNAVFSANLSETGPRVKINRQVFLENCRFNSDGMMFPDARILGTNGVEIVNGDDATSVDLGTHFGQVHAITAAVSHVFMVTNQGVRPLLVSDVAFQGGNTNDWAVLGWPGSGIEPGASAPLTIRFDPQAPGVRRTLLFAFNNDPDDDPYALWLSGEGVQAEMLVLATNDYSVLSNGVVNPLLAQGTDFGDVRLTGDPAANAYIVTNTGSATMHISSIAASQMNASDFSVTDPAAFPVSVAPGGTNTATLVFAPQALGYRATLLRVESDAVNSPYLFGIIGRGVEPEMRVLGTNSAWVVNGDSTPAFADGTDFGLFTAAPIVRTFSITNAGSHLLTLTGTAHVVMRGANPADFTVTAQPVSQIAPASAATFTISFTPLVATSRTAEVFVYSDDVYYTNAVYQFSIRGACDPANLFANIQADVRPASSVAMAWGDFNNDGLADLAVCGNDGSERFTSLNMNLGGGSFSNINAGLPGVDSGQLAWGDCNNDGWLDLVVSGISTSGPLTAVFRNNSDSTFSNIDAGLTGLYAGGLAWGDLDNDGDLDLFVSGYTLSDSASPLYRNNGDETFTLVSTSIPDLRDGQAAWLDADQDGWQDLLVSGQSGEDRIARVYRNISGVLTNQANAGLAGVSHGGFAIADFNNDGMADIATTGYGTEGRLSDVYTYGGSNSLYTITTTSLEPLWLGRAAAGDLDNNGWMDLMLSGEGSGGVRATRLYMNHSGTFSNITSAIPDLRVSSMVFGDYDDDGDLDTAVAGLSATGQFSAIYRNLSAASNQPPSAPAGLMATLTNGNEVALRWDAATDDKTTAGSLTYNLYVGTSMNPVGLLSPHSDLATGKRRVFSTGNTGHRREWRVRNLPVGETIVWGVQAVDGGYAGSLFTNGAPIAVPALPDFVVSGIHIQLVPFSAAVTILNQGTTAASAGRLSVWLNRATVPVDGQGADVTQSVGELMPGATNTVVFTNFTIPTNTATHVFRAFINSDRVEDESNKDNNQLALTYVHTVYEPFWFRAVALTNNVYLRWINPTNIGMQSSQVLIHHGTTNYPASPAEGAPIYQGSAQVYEHTGITPGHVNFYTIWLTNDETNWLDPPR